MEMSPFLKGALGFLGCAIVGTAIFKIGEAVGKEKALKAIEDEERYMEMAHAAAQAQKQAPKQTNDAPEVEQDTEPVVEQQPIVVDPKPSAVENVRKMRGFKNTLFGGTSIIKDLLKNPDGKKLVVTVENGEVVARISQNQGG